MIVDLRAHVGPLDMRMPAIFQRISKYSQNKRLDVLSGHMTNGHVEGQNPFCRVKSPAMHQAPIRHL